MTSIRHVRGVCIHYCGRAHGKAHGCNMCCAEQRCAYNQGPFLQLRVSCTSVMSQTAKEVGEEKQATRNSCIQFQFDVVQSGERSGRSNSLNSFLHFDSIKIWQLLITHAHDDKNNEFNGKAPLPYRMLVVTRRSSKFGVIVLEISHAESLVTSCYFFLGWIFLQNTASKRCVLSLRSRSRALLTSLASCANATMTRSKVQRRSNIYVTAIFFENASFYQIRHGDSKWIIISAIRLIINIYTNRYVNV